MPVYNANKYVAKAIEGILSQSYSDYEFLILNDGSTDNSEEIILDYRNSRIRYFKSGENSGLIYQLNKGIELAQGKYIARMDADDISLPTRLEKQVEFLEQNPDCAVVGCSLRVVDEKGKLTGESWQVLTDWERMRIQMLFQPPFPHPGVMMRADVMKESFRYDEAFYLVEDFRLWTEVAKRFRMGNIAETLLLYRSHGDSTTHIFKSQQLKNLREIFRQQLSVFAVNISEANLDDHLLTVTTDNLTTDNLKRLESWLYHLVSLNESQKVFDLFYFRQQIIQIWFSICFKAIKAGTPGVWNLYSRSKLVTGSQLSFRQGYGLMLLDKFYSKRLLRLYFRCKKLSWNE